MTRRVALVTCEQFPQLYDDDQLLQRALWSCGVAADAAVWSRADIDWSAFDLAVIRSTWDYHRRLGEFRTWLDRTSEQTAIWNRPELVRWNSHKTYLRDLRDRGVEIVPTEWVDGADQARQRILDRGWRRAVVKPSVSANADRTRVIGHDEPLPTMEDGGEAGWMVQPYVAEVEGEGERSLIFLDGAFSHAVQRKAALNPSAPLVDGTPVRPTDEERACARRALSATRARPLYARADLVTTGDGVARVMELELIEPLLYLRTDSAAAGRFARCILAALDEGTGGGA